MNELYCPRCSYAQPVNVCGINCGSMGDAQALERLAPLTFVARDVACYDCGFLFPAAVSKMAEDFAARCKARA